MLRNKLGPVAATGVSVVLVTMVGAAWWLGIFTDPPDEVSIDRARRSGVRSDRGPVRLAGDDLGIAIGAGTDVAMETADVVLLRSDPLDVPTAPTVGRGTPRKMHQNLAWAVGYNVIALPIAAGIFEPSLGLQLRPEWAAITMSGSSIIVATNALPLKRLQLPIETTAPDSSAAVPMPASL